MTRSGLVACALVGLALFAALLATRAAAGEKSESKVKATATATKPDAGGKQVVTITINIAKDWYIYANPVGNKFFEDNRTNVSIKAKEKVKVDVVYPEGKVKTEGATTIRLYQPQVVIVANVQRTPGDASPLQIRIDINSCRMKDGKTVECLFPGAVQLTVP